MANTQNFEKLLEYIVNGEQEKAEELFHSLVVEKSRDIYEGLFDEEMNDVDLEEAKKCDKEEDMEESSDEETEESVEEAFIAFSEEPGVGGDPAGELGGALGAGNEFSGEENPDMGDMDDMDNMGGTNGGVEARVDDLEDALDDLKAEFEKLMADEEGEPEHNDGENDPDFDDMDDEEGDEEGEPEDNEEEADESFNFEDLEELDLSPVEQMREYVEKIGDAYKGGKVASSSETGAPNTKSVVAGKNDMGGTTANIAKGGEGSTKGTAGGLLNPTPKVDDAGNVNKPGNSSAATKQHPQTKGHGAEKKGAGEQAHNTKSVLGK